MFMVPTMSRLGGTENDSPEYGNVTEMAFSAPSRLSGSINVISSPKILLMLPRLISSITIANC
ncbi:hypothetical protein D3C78_1812040 [compost metagenome]